MLWGHREERSSFAEVHAVAYDCCKLNFSDTNNVGHLSQATSAFLWDELGSQCSRKTLGYVALGARGTGTASPGKPALLPPWEVLGSLAALWALNSSLTSPQRADKVNEQREAAGEVTYARWL